jgi:hypothetical protein
LSGGIAGTDQRYFLIGAEFGLERRSPVVDARSLKEVEAFDIEPSITRAAGDDHGAAADTFAAI